MINDKSSKFILFIILTAFLFRGIFLVAVFPIFKGQDEARHYNTIQYLSTGKSKDCQNKSYWKDGRKVFVKPEQIKQDLSTYRYSDEIRETALISQSKQIRGNYYDKIVFTDGFNGLGEEEFKQQKHSKTQRLCSPDIATSMFNKDSLGVYHKFLKYVESVLKNRDIFVRYDVLRIISILMGVLFLYLSYQIFLTVGLSKKQSLILTAIISFQPKLVIYFTNINYDVLLIPLWTGFILISSLILKKGWNFWRGLLLILLTAGAITTKPSALPLLGLVLFLVGKTFYSKSKKQKINWVVIVTVTLIGGVVSYLLLKKVGVTTLFSEKYLSRLGEYLSKSLPKVYGSSRDYWGAMRWSTNNLSLIYVKTIWLIEWVAWFGLGLWVIGPWTKRFISNFAKVQPLRFCKGWTFAEFPAELQKQKKYLWFMLVGIISLQIGIRVADWKVFAESGSLVLGTPGRYWLPNIVPHFVLLAMGLKVITGFFKSKRLREKYFELSLLMFLVLMILYWSYEVFDVIIPRFYL